jgi:hypothetical protein
MRFIVPALRSLAPGRGSLEDRQPWITFPAQQWLSRVVHGRMRVFEYGSGGSTLYFAARVESLVSVEHDPEWFTLVDAELARSKPKASVRYLLIEPELGSAATNDPHDPSSYASRDNRYRGYSFERYVRAIDEYPDESFELVFVDGRARASCIVHAVRKTMLGGYIVLDNAGRSRYRRAMDLLAALPRRDFHGPGPYNRYFWMTTAWRNC